MMKNLEKKNFTKNNTFSEKSKLNFIILMPERYETYLCVIIIFLSLW